MYVIKLTTTATSGELNVIPVEKQDSSSPYNCSNLRAHKDESCKREFVDV